jgi:signal peptidase I
MAQNAQDPRVELDRKRARLNGAKRWIRRLRWALGGALLLVGVYAFLTFKLYTVPGEFDPKSKRIQSPIEDVQKGDTLLLMNLNLWREPKLGDVVFYDHPAPHDGAPETMLGRIAGLPGETVKRAGPTMTIGGRAPLPVGFDLGDEVAVKDGDVIPEGRYLIITDTDALAYGDTRDFGYVSRDSIHRKVVMNLAPLLGHRQKDEQRMTNNQ